MLSRDQAKRIGTGVSLYAIGQLLLVGFILFLWGKSFLGSFEKMSSKPVPGILDLTLSQEELVNRALTPTATPWVIQGSQDGLQANNNNVMIIITPTPEFVPTMAPTATPEPTELMWYQNLYVPYVSGLAKKPDRVHDLELTAKLSYYWPPYAYGSDPAYLINCDVVNGQPECEHMANGEHVKDYIGEAVACPVEFPFGTVIQIWDEFYTCRDRGGAITRIDEYRIWLDILYPYMPHNATWGQEEYIKIWLP